MKLFERILAATDLSEASTPALEKVVQMALDSGAQLWVAHAYPLPASPSLTDLPPGVYEDLDQAVRADAHARVQALVDRAREKEVDARPLVLIGFPDAEIVEAATREKVDLIVMGTHGRRGAARFVLGSVATRVLASAPCPVMTVRASPSPARDWGAAR